MEDYILLGLRSEARPVEGPRNSPLERLRRQDKFERSGSSAVIGNFHEALAAASNLSWPAEVTRSVEFDPDARRQVPPLFASREIALVAQLRLVTSNVSPCNAYDTPTC